MAENDLSKIVGLIMENPKLIEEIKNLGAKDKIADTTASSAEAEAAEAVKATEEAAPAFSANTKENYNRARRKDLLYALKPYVSDGRSRVIESMLSIADILDMMKTR